MSAKDAVLDALKRVARNFNNDAKKLKALEDENRRLKQMVADQALDIQALKAVVSKKW